MTTSTSTIHMHIFGYVHNNRTYVHTYIRNRQDDDAFLNYKTKFLFVLVYLHVCM